MMKIAIAQINPTVGDLEGNLKLHQDNIQRAIDEKCDLIIFPELSLTGYPPEDLLLRQQFLDDCARNLENLIKTTQQIYCLVGHPKVSTHGTQNACTLFHNGKILGEYAKQHLPNYGIFDERRYFVPGNQPCVVEINQTPVGIVICEDLWFEDAVRQASNAGAKMILAPNASPFEIDKHERRLHMLCDRARENKLCIVYNNMIGGQDELIFDGDSMVVCDQGKIIHSVGSFHTALSITTLNAPPTTIPRKPIVERVYQALVLGVKDYVEKNNLRSVIIGISGGIDSALTATIAVDAIGADRVHTVYMPSQYSSTLSLNEATQLAQNLHVPFEIIPINAVYQSFKTTLAPFLTKNHVDVTEQNIQARCRAVILMALSNKFGHLVLTTGNRSELAVGYCTLYGDMAGGYGPLKDVPKTLVYELANYRNSLNPVIPPDTIKRPPTAELAPGQKDEDALPPYPILDKILELYLNQGLSEKDIAANGIDSRTVKEVVRLIKLNEYKRRQAAIGPRINHTAFGRDWRYPITNGYKSK